MPPGNIAEVSNLLSYLNSVASKPDSARLLERVSPVFDVFTQHLPATTKKRLLEEIVQSTYIIPEEHVADNVGLHGSCSKYERAIEAIEVAEQSFDEKGYLEWATILKLGDMSRYFTAIFPFNIYPLDATFDYFNIFHNFIPLFPSFSAIKQPKIAADAVAAFYLNQFASHGLPKEGDMERLWVKRLIPVGFQGEGTRELAFKLGNYARRMEQENPGAGLQHIYELTR